MERNIGMDLENVYFFNGSAYAGKSTMVKRLAEKYDGIACEENYHESLMGGLDWNEFPNLGYTANLKDWADFIRRTPDEYAKWIEDVAKECEILELRILEDLVKTTDKKIFVDTNISLETLGKITDKDHVLIMLADPSISVSRFFDRPDSEKQFLYQLLLKEKNPDAAIANFRACLEKVNSQENYDKFLHSGFQILLKDESRSIDETMQMVELYLKLVGQLSLALAKIDVVVDDMNILKNVCEWAIPALNEKVVIDKSFLESYQRRFRELYDELPKQIIHRDPNPSNIITNDDKWGFIDFDLSECSVRIYDPCYAASAILSESFELDNPDKLKKWIEIFREIMYGYDAVAKLTESEKEAIPYVLLANQFIATSWFADKDKYKDIYEVNVSMTEWMIDHFENLKI